MTPQENPESGSTYADAGVDQRKAGESVGRFTSLFQSTFDLREGRVGRPLLPLGHFANVLDLGQDLGLAIATDGVGTKLLVAQMAGKFDTVGIDCIAMNVNDLLCIGAEPISFVDYIACSLADPDLLYEVARGLAEGARQARVAIPGGEIAQVAEMLAKHDGPTIDLVGTAVGVVPKSRIITGKTLEPGDVLLGLPASGVHSNGFTLARRVLFETGGLKPDETVSELNCTVAEELLVPTRIYVPEIVALFEAGIDVRALVHITGDGLLNLRRLEAPVGYSIDQMPPVQPIFSLIQSLGKVSDPEMYEVFNMGLGFVIAVPPGQEKETTDLLAGNGSVATRLGTVTDDPTRTVVIRPAGLRSGDEGFVPVP